MGFLVLSMTALICWATPWRTGLPLDPVSRWVDQAADVAQARSHALVWWLTLGIVLPLVLLAALLWIVEGAAYGLVTLCIHVIVLLACVSRTDPLGAMSRSIESAWRRGDQQAASLIARRDWAIHADNPDELAQAVRARVTLEALRGYFVPAFWYLLLGPVAALGYRLASAAAERNREGSAGAAEAVQALDWLPVRLLGLSLALVGRYSTTVDYLKRRIADWDTPVDRLAGGLIEAAMDKPSQVSLQVGATRRLLVHALLVWAVFAAFLSLVS